MTTTRRHFPLRVSAAQGKDRVWRFTGLESQAAGRDREHRDGARRLGVGRADLQRPRALRPDGTLSASNVSGNLLQDNGGVYATGSATANAIKYTAASGALVFATGTNQWNWGLLEHRRGHGRARLPHPAGDDERPRRHGRHARDADQRDALRRPRRPRPSSRARPRPPMPPGSGPRRRCAWRSRAR